MLITILIVACFLTVFIVFNRKNTFAYILSVQFLFINILALIGMLYISKVGQYAFPLRGDYDIYRMLYRIRLGVPVISRIYNIAFAMMLASCVVCTGFVYKMNKFMIAVLCIPAVLFAVWSDYSTQLALYITVNSGQSNAVISFLSSKGNSVFEWVFLVYMLMPVTVSVVSAIKTKIFVKKRNLGVCGFCFGMSAFLFFYLFVDGIFCPIWFKNVDVSKIPLASVRVSGYMYSVWVIVFVVILLAVILVWFKPYNIFKNAYPQYQIAKRLYYNLDMILHVYKNVFLMLGQQINLIRKGVGLNDTALITRVSDLSADVIEEYMELNTKIIRLMRNVRGEFVRINVLDCLNRAVDLTNLRVKARVNLNTAESEVMIMGVSECITEVFVNVFLNAIDAMSVIQRDAELNITIVSEDDYCMIEVQDNGVGMEKNLTKRIFEPFFTTKKVNGSGLGLHYVQNIINQHRGDIKVLSKVGEFTRMQIALPVIRS